MNLATIIDGHPDGAVALIHERRPTTYGVLRQQVAHLRGGFRQLGMEPGDRLALVCGNNPEFVVAYLAALGAGLVVVPLNPASPTRELTRELGDVGARAAIVASDTGSGPAPGVGRGDLPALERVIAIDGATDAGPAFTDLLDAEPADAVDRADDELAVLLYTSGTAGAPKAVMLTHGNLRANIDQLQAVADRAQTPADISLGAIPLFHIFGLNVVLGVSLAAGSRVLLVERFDPTATAELVAHRGVTVIMGPPAMWSAWAGAEFPSDTFAGVRLAASGAAKLPRPVFDACKDRFGLTVLEGYGLTEASPAVCVPADGSDLRPGSIGGPLPGVEVRLVDPTGDDVLVGDPGEVWVRGPNVFIGYWNDPEASARALTPDGWLRTGDVAVVDDNGGLYLVDRLKDLVIVSGFNVYPAEVEEVLLEHDAVEAAAVVGVPHPQTGEAVKAFVALTPGSSVEAEELIEFCVERLARYKCPSEVVFTDGLPEGLVGKVLRRGLEPPS